jgi:hypothetical protein
MPRKKAKLEVEWEQEERDERSESQKETLSEFSTKELVIDAIKSLQEHNGEVYIL